MAELRPASSSRGEILAAIADPGSRRQVARILVEHGYSVREVVDARAALAAIEAFIPDLLIVALTHADAQSLLDALRGHPVRGAMAVLGIDGAAENTLLLDLGADDVLGLPINSSALRIAVISALRLKQGERATRSIVGQNAREQQILHRAAQRLATCANLDDVLTVAAEVVRANFGYDRVNIALLSEVPPVLRSMVSTDDLGRVYMPRESSLTVGLDEGSPLLELPAYQAILVNGHESFYVPDTGGKTPAYVRPFLDGPVRETLLVALRSGDRVEGILTVDNLLSGREFGPEAVVSLVALARQVGTAVARTRITDALEARALEAEALATAGARLASALELKRVHELVLEQARILLPHDHGLLLVCDGAWARFVAGNGADQLHPGTPVIDLEGSRGAALAATGGHAMLIGDVTTSPVWHDFPLWAGEHRIRSTIVIPLLHDATMLACLCVSSFTAGTFSERQAALATQFGMRAAQAVANARMYRAAVDRALGTEGVWSPDSEPAQGQAALFDEPVAETRADDADFADVSESGNAGRQAQVVDNLRLLSWLDSGGVSLITQAVAVRALIERAIHAATDGVHDRHISLKGPDDLLAFVDPDRAAEILGNLLDNAARYSSEARPITVTWKIEERSAVVRIQDHGSGIGAQNRRLLFTRFGWLPGTSERRSPKGIGLGLYLGRTIADAMGGSLDLEATSAKGSTFRLKLPLPPD